jgi:hypothetical protein
MHIYAINYCFQVLSKAFGKLVGNWKIIELFESERPKIIKISAIRNHQVGVRYAYCRRVLVLLDFRILCLPYSKLQKGG